MTETPQYIATPADGVFGSGNSEILDELSFMFPAATHTLADSPVSYSSNNTYSSSYQPQQSVIYTQGSAPERSYAPDVPQTVFRTTLPQHPPPPIRTQSLPNQNHSSPMIRITPRVSPSPQSPQPQSPETPNSATSKSAALPRPGEPQIRYNQACFNYSIQKNKSIPLDPASFGR